MPRNRKLFLHNTALFVTSRIEEGLPLVPSHFLNEIIWGILGKARKMYQVKVCHFVFMSNHFHMLIVVDNPEDVSHFVGYVKSEIAHRINKLLGRRQKTIWCKGYDSPLLLTANDVLRYINYIYMNPVKANLVESIRNYPGVSSWSMFANNLSVREYKHIGRKYIPRLPFASLSVNEQKRLLKDLESENIPGEKERFLLEPYAWVNCFAEYRNMATEKIFQKIYNAITKQEANHERLRRKSGQEVIGSTSLRRQSMLKNYTPTKFTRRMICISSDIDLRERFIAYFRSLCSHARKIYQQWKHGMLELRIPIGLLSPRMPVFASSLTKFT